MNNTILSILLALLVGIAIGWVARPAGQTDEQVSASPSGNSPSSADSGVRTQPSQPALTSTPGSSKSGPRSRPSGQPDPGDTPWSVPAPEEGAGALGGVFEEAAVNVAEFRQQMRDHLQEQHAEEIAVLASELNLTAEQQDQLRSRHFDPLAESRVYRFYPDEGQEYPAAPASLASVLSEVLTQEQKTAYEEFRTSQRRQFIEAETLEAMAGLTFLDLTPDQRDAVYDQVYREIESEMAEQDRNDGGAVLGAAAGALGGAIIGNNVGDGHAARGALIGAGVGIAPKEDDAAKAAAEQARQTAITRELDRFREVLTPEQLDTYRRQLEREHSGNVYQPLNPHLPPLE